MRWNLKSKPQKEKVQALQDALQVDEIVATLLVQRGIETSPAGLLHSHLDRTGDIRL